MGWHADLEASDHDYRRKVSSSIAFALRDDELPIQNGAGWATSNFWHAAHGGTDPMVKGHVSDAHGVHIDREQRVDGRTAPFERPGVLSRLPTQKDVSRAIFAPHLL